MLFLRDRRVFDDVVQDGRDDRVGIEVQVGEDVGGGERMRDVGLAREALLALVGVGAELGGLADALDLLGRQVGSTLPSSSLRPGVRLALVPGIRPSSEDA